MGDSVLLKDVKTIKNKNVDITKLIHNNKVIWGSNVYIAKDSDFVKINNYWIYKGSELEVEIPEYINGTLVTNCIYMFSGHGTYNATPVTKVILRHDNVTNMAYMFYRSSASTLDLSSFNTSNVINMAYMLQESSASTLDLSSFNTSNVINMAYMFYRSSAIKGYARTLADAQKFNASSDKPTRLKFVVK